MKKEKRKNMRLEIISGDVAMVNMEVVTVKNLSPEGIYVYLDDITKYKVNSYCIVDLFLPESMKDEYGAIPIKGKIIRVDWRETKDKKIGMTIKFEYEKERVKSVVESLICYTRNRQIVSVSKRILKEVMGKNLQLT
jgi:hypothetical protein